MFLLRDVSKVFKDHKRETKALDSLSLTLPEKGRVFVIGKSGSGKSTFLNLLAGFSSPTSGEILFNGRNLKDRKGPEMNLYRLEDIAFIFQNYCVLEDLSVKENVALGFKESKGHFSKEIKDVLEKVGLSKYADTKAGDLSGGEKQRVAIARALIKSPYAILCDEPTGNLDKSSSKEVLDLLKECSKRALVVIVSHNLFDAYEYADRILSLDKGIIVDDRTISKEELSEKTIVLHGQDFLDETFASSLDLDIKEGKIDRIVSKKDCYLPTRPCDLSDESLRPEKKEKHSIRFLPSRYKSFHISKAKNFFFCFLSSLRFVLSLLTLGLYQIKDYSLVIASDYFAKNEVTVFQKYSAKDHSLLTKEKVDSQDERKAKEYASGRQRYSFYRFAPSFGSYVQAQDSFACRYTKSSFYHASNAQGLLLSDEAFRKKRLRVDSLAFAAKADEQKKSGVYITDYFADSILSRREPSFKTYEDLVGSLPVGFASYFADTPDLYVNGILSTGYEEKYKDFFSELSKSTEQLSSSLYKNEYLDCRDYIRNSLLVLYSDNRDFFDDLKKERTKSTIYSAFTSDIDSFDRHRQGNLYISYNKNLKDNEIILSDYSYQTMITDSSFKEGRVDKEHPRTLRKVQSYSEKKEGKVFVFDKRYRKGAHPELMEGCPFYTSLYVSEKVFDELREEQFYKQGFYLEGRPTSELLEKFTSDSYYPKSIQRTFSENFYDNISSFRNIFVLFCGFCFFISLLVLFFYVSSSFQTHRLRIAIYRSLGYSSFSILSCFLFRFFLFSSIRTLLTRGLYGIAYPIANKVLCRIRKRFILRGAYIKFDFLFFYPKEFLYLFLVSVVFVLVLALLVFLRQRRKKLDEILKNGDE